MSTTTSAADIDASAATRTYRTYYTGFLLLRVAIGLIMTLHGLQQLAGWFGGGGIDGTAAFFADSGYSSATLMAVVSGLSHTLGGLALILGLLTPLACAAIIGAMINAAVVKWSAGFFIANGGNEYELFLIVAVAIIAITGPGRFAIDHNLPVLRAHRLSFGLTGILLGAVVATLVLAVFR